MKTIDIEVALLKELNNGSNIVVQNVSWGIIRYFTPKDGLKRGCDELHECDIISVTKSGNATEYEIKVSKSDFMADKKKKHNHDSKFIKQMFYVTPESMKDWVIDKIPENSGFAYVTEKGQLRYSKNAPIRKDSFKWTNEEMFKLARLGAMRITTLKKNIQKLQLLNK